MTGKSTKTILGLHGSYFGHNFGDILLMRIFCGYMRECSPGSRIVLPLASHERQIEIGADGIGMEDIPRALGVVFGGGGYLGEKPRGKIYWSIRNYRRHVVLGKQLRRRGIPYAIIGVGLGPLSIPLIRKAMVGLCNGAGALLFRDTISAEFAVSYGVDPNKVRVGADAAITVSNCLEAFQVREGRDSQAQRLGIHLAAPRGKEDLLRSIAAGVEKFCGRGRATEIVFMSDEMGKAAFPSEYTESVRRLQEMVGIRVILKPYEGVTQLLNTVASCSLILTNKLHVGIVAASLRKQIVSIPIHSKTIRFYRQIEREADCLHGGAVTPELVCSALEDRIGKVGADIPMHVRKLAEENRVLTSQFLESL